MASADLIIIGGGPSGMAAAIEARRNGVDSVIILESNDALGAKLLITGAGRCNFTNSSIVTSAYPRNGESQLVKDLVSKFDGQSIIKWFTDLGLKPLIDPAGRVFPFPEKARSLLSLLELELRDLGVKIFFSNFVTGVSKDDRSGLFKISTHKSKFESKAVLIAAGGKSYPSTGSDGNGYSLLRKLGHTITSLTPVMVPLNGKIRAQKVLHGQKWFAGLELLRNGKVKHSTSGDIMFTKKGITGLGVFELTAFTAPMDYDGMSVRISLFPEDKNGSLTALKLLELSRKFRDRPISELLIGFIPIRLIKAFTKEEDVALSAHKSTSEHFEAAVYRSVQSLDNILIPVTTHNGWAHGQVTAGGVSINEIDCTFQSNIVKGLWIAGEIVDVHGVCGGYNLHFAWTSGIIAARACSCSLSKSG